MREKLRKKWLFRYIRNLRYEEIHFIFQNTIHFRTSIPCCCMGGNRYPIRLGRHDTVDVLGFLPKWRKQLSHDNYTLYENAIISNRVNPDRIDQIIHYQGTKKFYIPSEQELLKYASDSYYEETEYTCELRVFLRQKLQADIISSESFVSTLSWMIRTEEPMQEQNNLIEKHNIGLDMKNANILFSHMQNLNNNSRKWANCGFTPMEIRMQFENK